MDTHFAYVLHTINQQTFLGVEAPENTRDRPDGAKYSGVSTFLAITLSVCFLL